eukprot:scaffold4442_cov125-Amphora_coffeaeformis.AAC.4
MMSKAEAGFIEADTAFLEASIKLAPPYKFRIFTPESGRARFSHTYTFILMLCLHYQFKTEQKLLLEYMGADMGESFRDSDKYWRPPRPKKRSCPDQYPVHPDQLFYNNAYNVGEHPRNSQNTTPLGPVSPNHEFIPFTIFPTTILLCDFTIAVIPLCCINDRTMYIFQSLSLALLLHINWLVNAENLRGRTTARQRRRLQDHVTRSGAVAFRITILNELNRSKDESLTEIHTIMAIPITEDGRETSDFLSIDLPAHILADHYESIARGHLILSVEGAQIQDESVVLGEGAVVTMVTSHSPSYRDVDRRLAQTGIRSVAALRVSVSGGPAEKRQVGYSAARIRQQIFEGPLSLVSQIEACSTGSLRIEPRGVYEVTVPGQSSDFASPADLRNRALQLLAQQQEVASAQDLTDHIIVILPPSDVSGFVGNAGVNHWVSTLHDLWALDVMVYMHEFGHNLGLLHASLTDGSGDYSGHMSATGFKPNLDGPAKCFNAASNRELGWFDSHTTVMNMFADPTQKVTLAAFTDATDTLDDPILVQVGKYYIQYNLAESFNAGTEILRNQVTIAHSEPTKTIVQKQGLEPNGAILELADFEGTGQTLRIEACKRIVGNASQSPNAMVIGITLGRWGSPCNNVPVDPKTIAPPPPLVSTITTRNPPAAGDVADTMPTCPDTSELRLLTKWGKGVISVTCQWIDAFAERQSFCSQRAIGAPVGISQVYQLCRQECHDDAKCARANN